MHGIFKCKRALSTSQNRLATLLRHVVMIVLLCPCASLSESRSSLLLATRWQVLCEEEEPEEEEEESL